MDSKVRLKRNVYIIICGVLLLAISIQIAHSQYILQFSRNEALAVKVKVRESSPPEPALIEPSGVPYCLVYDSSDEYSVKVKENARYVLKYMKKPVKSADVRSGAFRPEGCATVIVTVQQLNLLGDVDVLSDYAKQGGFVFLAGYPEPNDSFYRLYRKMGIIGTGNVKDVQGIHLTSNVLIGEKGLTIDDPFMLNSALTVELDDKSRVLAQAVNGLPLLWDFSYGKGKFMVFNGTILQGKIHRGLLAGAISLLEPDFIYPVFNSKIMFIDDFPAPIGNLSDAQIYRQYHRDNRGFFKDIWWPDMLKAAKRYDIKYTAVLIESYNDQVKPPFASPADADAKGLMSYGREVIKSGGEIGLHGYNHQSLHLSQQVAREIGYNPWTSVDHMAQAIAEAVQFAGKAFPNYSMFSYVPPSNVLSPEGREALKLGGPDIAVISSLYGEDETGHSYVQEFEIAPDGILEMPRITSGYFEEPYDRWAEASTITSLGVFSHFIHPDDVMDYERNNNLSWEKLYEKFTELLARLERTHPWLRAMTSTEAAIDMEQVLRSRVDWRREERVLKGTIKPFRNQAYFILRTERKIETFEGCKGEEIDDSTYLITANNAEFTIKWGE